MEPEHETKQVVVPEGGVSSPQGKNKVRAESSAQGVQCTQEELDIVMLIIPNEVKTRDSMVGGVYSLKYSNHDVSDAINFPYLAMQSYVESRGEGPSGTPLLEPT
jgi:hypothetical protein